MEKKKIIPLAFLVLSLLSMNVLQIVNADTTLYSVNGATQIAFGNDDSADFTIFVGEEFSTTSSLKDQSFDKISISLAKSLNPTGTLRVGIWNSTITPTSTNFIKSFGTFNVASLTSTQTRYDFVSTSYKIKGNDIVGVFYNDANGDNRILMFNSANAFDGINTRNSRYDTGTSAWVDANSTDTDMVLSLRDAPLATIACIDTTGDAETDVCFFDTNGDGVPDAGSAGALGAYRGTANATKFGTDLGCAFGITSCTNKDIKTNGVGLFYLLIIIIWSYAVLVFIHFEAKKLSGAGNVHLAEILNINPLLLVVMLVIDVGITFYLGWIPDLIFYSTIVVVIGLSAFGLYRQIRG